MLFIQEKSIERNGISVLGMHQELDPKPWYHSKVPIFQKIGTLQMIERKNNIG